jgi:hypothetical protein
MEENDQWPLTGINNRVRPVVHRNCLFNCDFRKHDCHLVSSYIHIVVFCYFMDRDSSPDRPAPRGQTACLITIRYYFAGIYQMGEV